MTDDTQPEPPAPPVPATLDLRRAWWLKLDITAFLNSDFNTRVFNDTAWRCGLTLIMRAWHQVPAASLPNDERALCHLAGLGRDLRTWRKVKAEALHGFILCNDGRLYHGFLCRMALEAQEELARSDTRRSRDRERKAGSAGIPTEETAVSDGNANDGGVVSDGIPPGNGAQDRTVQESSPQPPRTSGGHVNGFQGNGRRANKRRGVEPDKPTDGPAGIGGCTADAIVWRNRLSRGPAFWLSGWGARPDEPGCDAPATLVMASPWGQEVQRMAA